MKPDDGVRLCHMVDALNAAIRFTRRRRREDLDADDMLAFALVHARQIVGEAPGKISAETRERHPDIPWATVIGMRHRLVHAYFDNPFFNVPDGEQPRAEVRQPGLRDGVATPRRRQGCSTACAGRRTAPARYGAGLIQISPRLGLNTVVPNARRNDPPICAAGSASVPIPPQAPGSFRST